LIIGSGFLGSTIYSTGLRQGLDITNISKSEPHSLIDITKMETIENSISKIRPDVVINCAAITNVDKIEVNPLEAFSVNAEGAKNVALICSRYKIRLIHISTDSVFDGKGEFYKENDIPNPINEYAKSKKAGEDYVSNNIENHSIVRTNFYGEHMGGEFLFNWIIHNLKNRKQIIGFDDVVFTPLEITNLSNMLLELATSDHRGIIHLASDNAISKYQFAKTVATTLGFDDSLISKGSITNMKFIAKRPLNTSLDNSLARKTLFTKPVSLEDWLRTRISI
jgi:dTDP-4-dehydrorhamnose reductase